ncbi:hypothetical protein ACFYPA_04535 [Streptomyces sp. NPDC005775]|uniref:hypothetical protein n=1 Tax=unclassified Streptomyces TaxID=2593676 RepID=UPI0033C847C6
MAVRLVAASAVVAGGRSYAAIGRWSAHAPQRALAHLGGLPTKVGQGRDAGRDH